MNNMIYTTIKMRMIIIMVMIVMIIILIMISTIILVVAVIIITSLITIIKIIMIEKKSENLKNDVKHLDSRPVSVKKINKTKSQCICLVPMG